MDAVSKIAVLVFIPAAFNNDNSNVWNIEDNLNNDNVNNNNNGLRPDSY